MAADKLFRKPALNVIQGDTLGPMYGVVGAAATVTYLTPGKLAVMLTNDNEVDIAGATDISGNVGIVGYEDTPLLYKPATRDTAYAVGDHVAIHNTNGMRFRGFLAPATAAVAPGTLLYHADSSGNFQKYLGATSLVAGTGQPVPIARAIETITPANSTPTACWMKWGV